MQSTDRRLRSYAYAVHSINEPLVIPTQRLTLVILLIKQAQRFPPLAGFLLLMSGRPAAGFAQGILLGFLLTSCFINLINDIYWGMLRSNQHLLGERPCPQPGMGNLWADRTQLRCSVSCSLPEGCALMKNFVFTRTKVVNKRP